MVWLVPIENYVIPMVLLLNMHLIKATWIIFSCGLAGFRASSETQGRSVGPGKGATKVFKHRRKSPWVPTLTGPFPNGQANAGSWLGTKNALYYCAQSANSISWVLFVSSYTTVIDSITACLVHAPKKCMQSGIFQFDINPTFQNTGSLYTRA